MLKKPEKDEAAIRGWKDRAPLQHNIDRKGRKPADTLPLHFSGFAATFYQGDETVIRLNQYLFFPPFETLFFSINEGLLQCFQSLCGSYWVSINIFQRSSDDFQFRFVDRKQITP